jgi:hypothetical protein
MRETRRPTVVQGRARRDRKSDEDVHIIGEKSAQHHKEDGKRATEGIAWEYGMVSGIMQQGYAPPEKADL